MGQKLRIQSGDPERTADEDVLRQTGGLQEPDRETRRRNHSRATTTTEL